MNKPDAENQSSWRRLMILVALIVAGEACFTLPFVIPRIFRPVILEAFGITNFEFGTAISLYGVIAMGSYFFGGPLADRFSVRGLMSSSLLISAMGGVWLATIPSLQILKVLYAFWGVSTIFLFWAALIRATREWGSDTSQGTGFGLLDGGRGLCAALLASAGVMFFSSVLPSDAASASLDQRTKALQWVILSFTGFVVAAAVLVWVCVPARTISSSEVDRFSVQRAATVLKNKAVWLQSLIVLCAYVGYKGMDDYVLFARDSFEFDDVQSAHLGTIALWTRPIAAVLAGLLGDRIGNTHAVLLCFVGVLLSNLTVAAGLLQPTMSWILYLNIVGTGAFVYGLRGIYFALFREAQVTHELTGTATGIVSVIGYTPDVFIAPLMGYLTDNWPGATGHRLLFAVLAGFATCGIVVTLLFRKLPDAGMKR